jgi:hypothetical protein
MNGTEKHNKMVKIAEDVFKKIGYSEIGANTLAERATRWLESGRAPRSEAEREIMNTFDNK